jgi:hypothetical protein
MGQGWRPTIPIVRSLRVLAAFLKVPILERKKRVRLATPKHDHSLIRA